MTRRSRRRMWLIAVAAGTGAYLAALAATLPARLIFDPGPRWAMGGTVWWGTAVLGGAVRFEWRWSPGRTLANFGFAADWRATGGGTDLDGTLISTHRQLRLEAISGQADGALLAAALPQLPLACDVRIEVAVPRLVIAEGETRAAGELRSGPARCTSRTLGGVPVALPSLVAIARPRGRATEGWIAPAGLRQQLVAMRLDRDGTLAVAVTPAGGALLPMLRGLRYDARLQGASFTAPPGR